MSQMEASLHLVAVKKYPNGVLTYSTPIKGEALYGAENGLPDALNPQHLLPGPRASPNTLPAVSLASLTKHKLNIDTTVSVFPDPPTASLIFSTSSAPHSSTTTSPLSTLNPHFSALL
ncbi:hypothetical protein RSAG8_08289, partial [Rhizoctonia solani AG-8 WAC10335]